MSHGLEHFDILADDPAELWFMQLNDPHDNFFAIWQDGT
ncbi:MAG: hypothetical protein HW416_714 [Chloroflexi bacterium]|nr:hypothetical protein [Chloroflexota bacterium]